MAMNLTTAELNTLEAKELQAKTDQIGFWEIYQWLGDLLVAKGAAATDSSLLWLRGATEANAARGAFFELIRNYTETQYQLRYGTAIPSGKMQEASNAVAQNLINDLMGRNAEWPKGQVPDISRIAFADATAVGEVLFSSKLGHNETDTAFLRNSAWSGSLLFGLLRSDQTSLLMQGGGDPTKIDTLSDWRDVLYAFKSYEAGLKGAVVGAAATNTLALLGTSLQKAQALSTAAVDLAIFGTTVYGYVSGGSSDLGSALLAGTTNPVLKNAFSVIENTGANRFLDMLMGAVQGRFLQGTTTDANFNATAQAFLGGLTPAQLQIVGATLLPGNPAAIASLARTDVNARAALLAGSIVSVQVSPTVANSAALSLYDPATGQGTLTELWLSDRALFVTALGNGKPDTAGQLWRSANLPTDRSFEFRYMDGNGAEQLILAENTARQGGTTINVPSQVIAFGGDGADTLTGSDINKLGDHLYGGAGADTISGMSGDDYLEGGIGNDTLNGGNGSDKLYGGAGADAYRFGGNWGSDTVLDSDGQGSIVIDGISLNGGKRVSANAWQSADEQWRYALTETDELIISSATKAGRIIVKDWTRMLQATSTPLGLSLEQASAPQPPAPTPEPGMYALQGGYFVPGGPQLPAGAWQLQSDGSIPGAVPLQDANDLMVGGQDALRAPGAFERISGVALDSEGNPYFTRANTRAVSFWGLGGNDFMSGEQYDDFLDGGAGNDVIQVNDLLRHSSTALAKASIDTQGNNTLQFNTLQFNTLQAGVWSYKFRSCLRTYLLSKTSIRYRKKACHARNMCPCALHTSLRRGSKNTMNSIAACADKQGARGIFDSKNQPLSRQNQTYLTGEAYA